MLHYMHVEVEKENNISHHLKWHVKIGNFPVGFVRWICQLKTLNQVPPTP